MRVLDNGRVAAPSAVPDPEVHICASRRRFSAKYKLGVLEQTDACASPGEIGAILRREGLYASHLSSWRKARREGTLQALAERKRGPAPQHSPEDKRRIGQLEREIERLQRQLAKCETIIECQKKLATLLGIELGTPTTSNEWRS